MVLKTEDLNFSLTDTTFYKNLKELQKEIQSRTDSEWFVWINSRKCWDKELRRQTKDGLSGNLSGYSDGIFDFSILINNLDLTVSLILKENENVNVTLSKVNDGLLDKFVNRNTLSNSNSDTLFSNKFTTYIVNGHKVANLDRKYSIKYIDKKMKSDWVIYLFDEKDNLFPCIVQKKDGAYLYSTSDIATVKFRKNTYDVNKMIYLTDARQQDHFKQFFKITDMLGWNIEKYHIWFGIIRFADGILSTRKGNVIKLEELLDEAHNRAYDVVNEKNPNLSEEEKQNIAEVVGVSSVKYADLSQNKQSDIIFEWDKMLSFEGNTAPYLLYTYARIQSILRKVAEQNIDLNENIEIKTDNKFEKSLATYLLAFPISVLKAAETFKPNLIADYLYELSKKLNSFYNNCPILNQDIETLKSRALLIKKTGEVLKEGLELLGIPVLNKM